MDRPTINTVVDKRAPLAATAAEVVVAKTSTNGYRCQGRALARIILINSHLRLCLITTVTNMAFQKSLINYAK